MDSNEIAKLLRRDCKFTGKISKSCSERERFKLCCECMTHAALRDDVRFFVDSRGYCFLCGYWGHCRCNDATHLTSNSSSASDIAAQVGKHCKYSRRSAGQSCIGKSRYRLCSRCRKQAKASETAVGFFQRKGYCAECGYLNRCRCFGEPINYSSCSDDTSEVEAEDNEMEEGEIVEDNWWSREQTYYSILTILKVVLLTSWMKSTLVRIVFGEAPTSIGFDALNTPKVFGVYRHL